MNRILIALVSFFTLISANQAMAGKPKKPKLEPGIYAEFQTTKGNILVQLEYEKAPLTVANFVGLAEGKLVTPDSTYSKPYYDGLKFHRVIPNFMIQGGDPQGNGMGGPKHRFYDEFHPDLKHSGPGILSMANSGPGTNGSQFFITHVATPWLDNKHSVFGHVISGQDVVDSIKQDDIMKKVKIIRVGKPAKSWNASKVYAQQYEVQKAAADVRKKEEERLMAEQRAEQQRLEAVEKERIAEITAIPEAEHKKQLYQKVLQKYPEAKQTASGLIYIIENPGNGPKQVQGSMVEVHYTGTFLDGKKFDSSYDRQQPLKFKYKEQGLITGFYEALDMLSQGGKGKFILPYGLAYGSQGRQGMPAYSDLVFDLELMSVAAPVAPVPTQGEMAPPPIKPNQGR